MSVDQRAALFVRLPSVLAAELDARVESAGRSKQAVVTEMLTAQLDVQLGAAPDDVLDLAQTAALLKISDDELMARIAAGDFPARRLGDHWRCSRTAVIAWLAGSDPLAPRATGFSRRA
jgi:excisionase family DNA binding protein